MGLRFRRSWGLIPGVRLNLGLKSGSLSFGMRGLHYTSAQEAVGLQQGFPGRAYFGPKKSVQALRDPRLRQANNS